MAGRRQASTLNHGLAAGSDTWDCSLSLEGLMRVVAASVATLAAIPFLVSCASARPAPAHGVHSGTRPAPAHGVHGGRSPIDAARLYVAAFLRKDTAATDALRATLRADCPASRSSYIVNSLPTPTAGQTMSYPIRRQNKAWIVTPTIYDGTRGATSSSLTVVHYGGAYYVC
jgi:hypothetical protein